MALFQHIKKCLAVSFLILISSLVAVNAQDTIRKIKIYQTWVSFNNELLIDRQGVFYQIKDSSVSISNSVVAKDYRNDNFTVAELHINDIETIKIRRKNRILLGAGIGTIAGFGLGLIIGYASGDDPPCDPGFNILPIECMSHRTAKDKAFTTGTILGISGALLGMAFGSIKVKIPINGNQDNFNTHKDKLGKYPIMK